MVGGWISELYRRRLQRSDVDLWRFVRFKGELPPVREILYSWPAERDCFVCPARKGTLCPSSTWFGLIDRAVLSCLWDSGGRKRKDWRCVLLPLSLWVSADDAAVLELRWRISGKSENYVGWKYPGLFTLWDNVLYRKPYALPHSGDDGNWILRNFHILI